MMHIAISYNAKSTFVLQGVLYYGNTDRTMEAGLKGLVYFGKSDMLQIPAFGDMEHLVMHQLKFEIKHFHREIVSSG